MPANVESMRERLQAFEFKDLFIEDLGWDDHHQRLHGIEVEDVSFQLDAIAHKHGWVAFLCGPGLDGNIPDAPTRRKIERQVRKLQHEHSIIYIDADKTWCVWQWIKREPGKPEQSREDTFHRGQSGEALLQKLRAIWFDLNEEGRSSIIDVGQRVGKGFDVDKVAKKFYDQFKDQHGEFLTFIKGIPGDDDLQWYASVMLNRLMFIYFVQKKGFLDNDVNYLSSKLKKVQNTFGEGQFHSFYRNFLLALFHDGLGGQKPHSSELQQLIGDVPYLNGGLFDLHTIERDHTEIQIADAAFEEIFRFFDQWEWHLDDDPLSEGKEINPDVLGYIFEKYINQKQMGAYYTKEDITGYISKNTIVPFLFDTARKDCAIAFRPDGTLWGLLSDSPDEYIYDAVSKGTGHPLPAEIEAGRKDVTQRGGWNGPASEEYALPTETWREHVARRERHDEIWEKLVSGEVQSIDDLITYNLDIQRFAQDAIANCEGPELLRAFYKAISSVSVLDPTCGSGAFLFAALNVLQPLYSACLDRMRAFIDDLERLDESQKSKKYTDFRATLEQVEQHPNEAYFILKSIIVYNLYGVDIMEEAVEICKLRLFLKLASVIELGDEIEPLPDIDFNVRSGNTLVGFVSLDEIKRSLSVDSRGYQRLPLPEDAEAVRRIEERAEIADRAFKLFHEMQTDYAMDARGFRSAKSELSRRLDSLASDLDVYLAGEYIGNPDNSAVLETWKDSHQPFHWFAGFYGIIRRGGFDVVIGNPPYIASSKVRNDYKVKNYLTEKCPDIYAWVLERVCHLVRSGGRSGMIVPLSLGFSRDFDSCRRLLFKKYETNWFSSFARIPAALFSSDVRVRNTIHLGHKGGESQREYTTRLHRWFEVERATLFASISYSRFSPEPWGNRIPKLNTPVVTRAFESALVSTARTVEDYVRPTPSQANLSFKKSAYNWLTFCDTLPPCYDGEGNLIQHTKFGTIYFDAPENRDMLYLLLNGKLMFSFWCIMGDDFDLTRWMFTELPVDLAIIPEDDLCKLRSLKLELDDALKSAVSFKSNAGKRVGNYNLARCRHVTDRSDQILAKYVGLSEAWEDIELLYEQIVKTDFDDLV